MSALEDFYLLLNRMELVIVQDFIPGTFFVPRQCVPSCSPPNFLHLALMCNKNVSSMHLNQRAGLLDLITTLDLGANINFH